MIVGLLLDLNSIIYFFSGFPQLVTTIRYRKSLQALSLKTMIGQAVAGVLFLIAGSMTGAWIAVSLSIVGQAIAGVQLYYKVKNVLQLRRKQ